MFDLSLFFQWVIDGFANILKYVIYLLPDSPFNFIINMEWYQYIKWLNWIIPVGAIIGFLEGWLVAVLVFYAIKIILRWVKVIE